MELKRILVTGGAGYIGSHTVLQLLDAKYDVSILDNLCNSQIESIHRLEKISGEAIDFIEGDIRDRALLKGIFSQKSFDAVIHFAGLKSVGESVSLPLMYYENNIGGSLILFEEMIRANVKTLVFSSSATVYGIPQFLPITEEHPLSATNAYGQTKLMIEQMLRDMAAADSDLRVALLRYFNPVGAHISGLIGEDPAGIPNNLMPFVAQVAVGKLKELAVFGDDYSTVDGTGVRDFIHVEDLASGHIAALKYLQSHSGIMTTNLGTGRGTSVLEMIDAFETASGKKIPYRIQARRPGDVASCYADANHAASILGWRAQHSIERMCEDGWRWQLQNPQGYPR